MISPRAGLGHPNGFGVDTCPVLPGAWFWLFALLAPALGAPFVPARDDLVLEAVRSPGMVAAAKEIRSLERQIQETPEDRKAVLRLVRRLIEAARADGDPRLLGQAQSRLAPFFNGGETPLEAWVLRATVLQSLHDFDGAVRDLDGAAAVAPGDPEVWMLRAMIHCVRGDLTEARRSAARLLLRADPLVSATVAAQVASLTGGSAAALRQLSDVVARNSGAPASVRAWSLTLLGETAARRGDRDEAEKWFRTGLALAPRDPYLLGALADLLIDSGRPGDAVPLLRDFRHIDSLLLRLAEASPADRESAVRELSARMAQARARGDRLHLREESRLQLRLLGDAAAALESAEENWTVQKEPADARVLVEAARKAGRPEKAEPALAHLRRQGLEDVSLGLPVSAH